MAKRRALNGDDLNKALGVRIRFCREEGAHSLQTIAAAMAITTQQLQKYETGANRVAFSRLAQIADALNLSVVTLLGPLAGNLALLKDDMALEMLTAFARVRNPKLRRQILDLLKTLGGL